MSADASVEDAVEPNVATVVLVRDPSALGEGLDALRTQVYGSSVTIIVGGGATARSIAEARDTKWVGSMAELTQQIPLNVTYVWFVSEQIRARADALRALVVESQRIDASVAGSKALRLDDPQVLVSVGLATDVFAVPYLGIDHDERDQAQFDVIRDVAAASSESLLVRRDLLAGLRGPDPELAPESAGIDFCFRARLRGARIVVIPSSEVLVPVPTGRPRTPWREEAGRIRAMIKSYSLVTLLWALPLAFLLGLVEAIVAPLFGRWTLFGWGAAWLWNLARLPSAISARLVARRGRVAGDEELFRYQIRGSARLRSLGVEASELLQERLMRGRVAGLSSWLAAGQAAVRSAGFLSAVATIAVALGATRSIWSGRLPAVGFSLPPAADSTDVLASYAGGWNPAGLGTLWPLRPAVGAVAFAQRLLLDRPELTATVLTIAALIAGSLGLARLLRGFGLSAPASYLAGVVYFAGPAAAAIGDTTHWTALLALGPLPWVLRLAVRPWPTSWRERVGRVSAIALMSGLVAVFLPAGVVAAPIAIAIWAVLGTGSRWMALVRVVGAGAVSLLLLFPWLGVIDALDYVQAGEPSYWTPSPIVAGLVAASALVTIIVGDRLLSTLAGWGAILAVVGGGAARGGDFDFGADVGLAGLLLAALGTGLVIGASVETFSRLDLPGWRRTLGTVGVAASLAITVTTLPLIIPGRAGLPADEYRELLEFTTAISEDATASRVLLLGSPGSMPGESRSIDATAYRVISAPTPSLWEARLGVVRQADAALEDLLRSIVAGETARAGEALVAFGIEWVVFVDPTVLDSSFAGQLDLLPLPGLDETAFVNEETGVRAFTTSGTAWAWEGPGYAGRAAGAESVYVAEAADIRWGPGEWTQAGWANQLSAAPGEAHFSGRSALRNEAAGALASFVLLIVAAVLGVSKRRQ